MKAFILKRLFFSLPVIAGIILLTFVLFSVIGSNAIEHLAQSEAGLPAFCNAKSASDMIEQIRRAYGLDKPVIDFSFDNQFIDHLKKNITFQFSLALDREPVIDKITRGIIPSLSLTVPVFAGTLIISVSLALWTAYKRSAADILAVLISTAGMSVPYLGFIIFGQYLFAYKLGWFEIFYSPQLNIFQYTTLPVLIGIAAGIGPSLRFYRSVMLEQIQADYVRTAFAKGISPAAVLFRHVLPNAAITIIANVVSSLPYLFMGSFLLERFFGIAGLGYMIIDAVQARDIFVINAMVYIFALLFIAFDILADICYAIADPRVRHD